MRFLLANELKELASAKQVYLAASALDKHRTLQAKTDVNRLLVSQKGLLAAFSAGLTKGLISQSAGSSKSHLTSLMRLLASVG